MKKLIAFAAVAAAAAAPTAAVAQGQLYGSAGYTHFDGDGASPGALTGRVGVRLNPNIGIEGEASFGVFDDEVNIGGLDVDVGVENAFAGYLVGFLPVSDQVDLFGRLGYGTATIEGSAGGITVEDDVDGVAFGVGGQYFVTPQLGIRADYTRIDGDEGEADTFGVSAAFRF